ncbi:3-oxoacid CoA-transferase [Candidatus Bathyarchaeota archaeon]|nr:3-oxoacid CoA-transferase [Candidatus Bathyarchaeota archaeon]
MDYNVTELMACVASRTLEDGKAVLVGTGLPIVAATLAQKLHAPNLLIIFEAGGIGPRIPTIPISVGDSRTFHRAVMAASMDYVMSCAQLGLVDYAFLGAAQIDPYGNLNTTVIGPHDRPRVRLPGSGGGNDAGSLCWKTIILMSQDRRRFVEKLDFLTTPGYLTGPGARERAGLPEGTGPYRVITQLGVMGFDEASKRMKLLSIHPGFTLEDIRENTGFELLIREEVSVTEPPREEELRLLREVIDPAGIVIG